MYSCVAHFWVTKVVLTKSSDMADVLHAFMEDVQDQNAVLSLTTLAIIGESQILDGEDRPLASLRFCKKFDHARR